uniref:J domain-containing protein n=1 Tax=Dunaliella tertiolecta TaxID=3047 RepID=A0A7S3QKU5_DUNTE|mmetsp:Transcript_19/g.44  ORF Transcript_19/g.44 Transcript_19/m.44 type:complete len:413 (+) Transcript_19:142-1380(+)
MLLRNTITPQQATAQARRKGAQCTIRPTRLAQALLDRTLWRSTRPNRPTVRVAAAAEDASSTAGAAQKYILKSGLIDYYEILQVDDDATLKEIKKAYRSATKVCHPDFLGEEGHNICVLLNEAYEVLSDEQQRIAYNAKLEEGLKDEEDDYDGKPLSKWMPTVSPKRAKNEDPYENRAVFVDEFTCIGCKQCIWQAPATFRIEPEHGRSRVYAQWIEPEDANQAAIDSCPVDCIHWVDKDKLPALEYVMQKRMRNRTNVGVMMAGQGATGDVFAATEQFLKERRRMKEAQEEASRRRPYSPEQEMARRAAADALRKRDFISGLNDVMANMMSQMNYTVQGAPVEAVKVGRRKRAVRWDQVYGPGSASSMDSMSSSMDSMSSMDSYDGEALLSFSEDYVEIPAERALVPVKKR